jgi:hypothetical protein
MSQAMNVLVIENENEVPLEVLDLCRHGLSTGKFAEVEYWTNARNTTPADMNTALLKADAIMLKSKFLYKDQLEQFLHVFANILSHKPYSFFVWHFEPMANAWVRGEDVENFTDLNKALKDLREIVRRHRVYSIHGKGFWMMHNFENGGFVAQKEV